MKRPKKLRSVIFISLGVLLAVGISAILYLNAHLEDLLREQIDLHSSKDMRISFKDISINALTQSAEVDQIEVFETDSGFVIWSASVEKLFIKNFSATSLIRGNGVKLDSVVISGLGVIFRKKSQSSVRQNLNYKENQPKPKLQLHVDGIRISSGDFDYDPSGSVEASGSFNFLLSDFQYDSSHPIDLKKEFLNSKFTVHMDKLVSEDSLYTVNIQSIQKTLSDTISINGVTLSPNQSLQVFDEHYGWNKAMLEAEVQEIKSKIDLSGFPDFIGIPFCSVKGSKLIVKKDNRWPLPDRVTELPQELLSGLPIKFRLDSLSLSEAEIIISIIQENGKEASISIENVEATLAAQNLNDTEPALELNASQTVMGEASAHISTTYHYGDDLPFEYSLLMENTSLEFMSDFLQKSIGIEITKGQLNRLNLDMTGTKYASKGDVIFEYTDLAVEAVNKETGKKKKMLNALADVLGSLVFWKDNPAHDEYRTGTFSVERDVRKAFMAQWFEGLEAGIIEVVAKIDPLKIREHSLSKKKRKSNK